MLFETTEKLSEGFAINMVCTISNECGQIKLHIELVFIHLQIYRKYKSVHLDKKCFNLKT